MILVGDVERGEIVAFYLLLFASRHRANNIHLPFKTGPTDQQQMHNENRSQLWKFNTLDVYKIINNLNSSFANCLQSFLLMVEK